jgi:hypothetical protein
MRAEPGESKLPDRFDNSDVTLFCLRLATLLVAHLPCRSFEQEVPDMPLQNHLMELERKHQALEREIQDVLAHPSTDDTRLAELKRRKLHLKDEITRLKSSSARVMH